MGGDTEDEASARSGAPRALVTLHDVDLARRVLSGDRLAFVELARRHGSALRVFFYRLGVRPAQIDTLALESFSTALADISEFRAEQPFLMWLKTKGARHLTRRGGLGGEGPPGPWPALPEESLTALDIALEPLSTEARTVLGLVHGAGMAVQDCAEALGKDLSTVRALRRQAIADLGARLNDVTATSESDRVTEIERFYEATPALIDADLFARAVALRVDRGWEARRLVISVLGLAGGLVAVIDLAGPNLLARLSLIGQTSAAAASRGVHSAPVLANLTGRVIAMLGAPYGVEVAWLVVGLLVLAGGLIVARLIEEI